MMMITKYLKGALVALFLFLGLGFKHFKDKSGRLEKDLDSEKLKGKKQEKQVKTYLEYEKAADESIKKAKADSRIKRDYFE